MAKNELALTELDTKPVSYMVRDEEVKLSGAIVKKYLTRGNTAVNDQEVIMFMNLCRFQKLNPFLNEAYLVKFGNDAQIITGKEAFMKRAEECENFDGLQAGIIVQRGDQQLEVEGTFSAPGDKILGGWARVYRSDRKTPYYHSVSLSEYDKKQSVWKDKPSTMIRKVALVQALREAFPTNLGGLYTEDEMPGKSIDVQVEETVKSNANQEFIDIDADFEVLEETEQDNAERVTPTPEPSKQNNKRTQKEAAQMSMEGPGY